jgi:flagellar operon protein (TIGR03826 family)
MPEVRNCKRCNKIFNYIGGAPICSDCKQEDEVNFKKVKEYLYDHPKSSIYDVSKELEISIQTIKSYLKEGRLEIVGDGGNLFLECERCGKSISSGRYCSECTKEVTNDVKSLTEQMNKTVATEPVQTKRSSGIRYLNKE